MSSQPTVLAEQKEVADNGSSGGDNDEDVAAEEVAAEEIVATEEIVTAEEGNQGADTKGDQEAGTEGDQEAGIEGSEEFGEVGGEEGGEDDDFGDDFDDFEEGGHDDDFDDFEDGFQHAEPTTTTTSAPLPVQPQHSLPFVRASQSYTY